MSFELFGLYSKKLNLYKIKYEYYKQFYQKSQKVFKFFENFFVLKIDDYNKLYDKFSQDNYYHVDKIKIYPRKIINYFKQNWKFREKKISRILDIEKHYKNEIFILNNHMYNLIESQWKSLKQFYYFRNYLLYWVYNKNYEILQLSDLVLKRYDYFQNKCEIYMYGKHLNESCLGIKHFIGGESRKLNLYNGIPMFFMEDKRNDIQQFLWITNSKFLNAIDFTLIKEPIISGKFFYLHSVYYTKKYFMDFENKLLRLVSINFKSRY